MVAEAEVVVCPKSLPVLEVQYFDQIESIGDAISPTLDRVRASESVSAELSSSQSVCFSSYSSKSLADFGV